MSRSIHCYAIVAILRRIARFPNAPFEKRYGLIPRPWTNGCVSQKTSEPTLVGIFDQVKKAMKSDTSPGRRVVSNQPSILTERKHAQSLSRMRSRTLEPKERNCHRPYECKLSEMSTNDLTQALTGESVGLPNYLDRLNGRT